MISLDKDFLKGSYPPVITPFLENGDVDYDGYEKLVDWQIREGSHGIVVNGTSAEPAVLSTEERNTLVEIGYRVAKGRVPLMAATGSQSYAETKVLTDHAAKLGVDALLIVTPYYIRPPQRGLAQYYIELGKRNDLPLLMYHIPGRAAVTAELSTLERIAEATPHFVGIKHASLDLGLVTESIDKFGPEFRVFVGLEELSFPMLAMGACGMVNAVSNIAPKKISELYEVVASGDLEGGRRLHYELFELNQSVFYDINPIPVKYMAKKLGVLNGNYHRLPMVPATPEVEKKCDAVLAKSGLLKAAAA
jgi:4-hydroxy-tetrahydrodipicolinate synthase